MGMSEKEQDDFWSFQWLVAIFPDCNRPEEKDQFEVRNIPGGGPTNPDGTSMFATIQTLHQMRVEIRQAAAALARTDGFVVLTVKRANRTRPVYSTEPPRTFEHPVPHSSVPVLDPEVLNQKMSADGAIEVSVLSHSASLSDAVRHSFKLPRSCSVKDVYDRLAFELQRKPAEFRLHTAPGRNGKALGDNGDPAAQVAPLLDALPDGAPRSSRVTLHLYSSRQGPTSTPRMGEPDTDEDWPVLTPRSGP